MTDSLEKKLRQLRENQPRKATAEDLKEVFERVLPEYKVTVKKVKPKEKPSAPIIIKKKNQFRKNLTHK